MSVIDLPARPLIAASWQRCRLEGVRPDVSIDSTCVGEVDCRSRLVIAADPVLDDVALALEGTGYVVILAERESRVVSMRYGTREAQSRLQRLGIVEGRAVGEGVLGTNSIGTALEVGSGVMVHGDEHYIESLKTLSCYGQPIFNPITHRVEGALGITCAMTDANALLIPFLRRAVREIETRLLAGSRGREQQLLAAFQSAQLRDTSVPVVALNKDIFLANTAAVEVVATSDHAVLRVAALEAKVRATQKLQLSTGQEVSMSVTPVADGALFTFEPCYVPSVPNFPNRTRPIVAVCGEPGAGSTGKATELVANSDAAWFDAADIAVVGERDWLAALEHCLAGSAPVVIEAVHLMSQPVARRVAAALRHASARTVLTSAPLEQLHGEAQGLIAQCVDRIELPPLRARRYEIPTLIASMLVDLGVATELRFTASALEALVGHRWPGNLRELESVVRAVVQTRKVGDVTLRDLPERYRDRAGPRLLTPMEQAEHDAIARALRVSGGNKRSAATHLGISRTTLYRRMRQYGTVASQVAS